MSRFWALMLILTFGNCPYAFATDFDQNGIVTMDFPKNGAKPGQGISLDTGLSMGTCVEGAAPDTVGQTTKTPQTVWASLRNNKDASTYFHELSVSASAQAAFLAGSADIKTTYVTKHQFDQTTDTISIYERAEQHRYLAPSDNAAAPTEAPGQRLNITAFNGIHLNKRSANLLSHGKLAQFQSECGSGFVAVVIEGGELIATLTVQDHKASDSNSLDINGSVSVFGNSVNDTVQNVVNESSNGHSVSLDLFTTGGSGDAAPIDKTTLLKKVQSLPNDVSGTPAPFQVVVRTYRSLPDFPANVPPFEKPLPLDDIMALYWRVDAILTQAIVSSRPVPQGQFGLPFPFSDNSVLMGFNGAFPDQVNSLVDQLIQKRTTLASQATDCLAGHNCGSPVVSQIDIYSLAARLPLPISAETLNLLAYRQVLINLRTAIDTFNVAKSRAIANALGAFGKGPGPQPNCAAQIGSVNTELNNAHQREQLIAAFNTAQQWIETSAPSLLRDDAVDFFVRRPARAHCSPSPFDQACRLTEVDFAQIAQSVTLKDGVQITPQADLGHVNDWGACPFMTGPIPLAGYVVTSKP